jgi:hypothetical protein
MSCVDVLRQLKAHLSAKIITGIALLLQFHILHRVISANFKPT